MEPKQKSKVEQKTTMPKGEKMKSLPKMMSSETDSSISMTYDSSLDCGYRSGDLSATQSSTSEHLSSCSYTDSVFQMSKSDQNLRFDSGLGTDYTSPLSSESCFMSEDYSKAEFYEEPKKTGKFLWQDIFSQDKDGDTLLHLAIVEARSDIIFPLIRLAPHPDFLDITNDLDQTPLHLATLTGKSNIVRRLVVAGATLDIQDHSGNIPLHIACRSGDLDCVRSILTPITDSEVKEACCSYQIYIQDTSLSYLINMKNFDGQSCIHLAASGGFKKVLEFLFSQKADIDEQDGKSGRTALHYAVENENFELVHLLLSKCNANPHVQNYAGQTSHNVACALCKRKPQKNLREILDTMKKSADRSESGSESAESDSSSDEDEFADVMLQNSRNPSVK